MNADVTKFDLGDFVYKRMAPDELGMITGILWRPHGVVYLVTWAGEEDENTHYDIELTRERNWQEELSDG